MAKVRVILRQKFRYPAGFKLKVYGHDFVVQKDGTAAAMIDEIFLKGAEHRYVLAEEGPKEIPVLDTSYVDSFGYDVGQYYGAGSLEKLKKRIEDMRKGEISHFAQTRLGEKIRMNQSKNRMIFELIDIIKKQLESEQPDAAPDTAPHAESDAESDAAQNTPSHKIEVTETSKDNADKIMFTFVEPEEKAASSEEKVSTPIKEKTREELLAELNELEKLADERKTKLEPEKKS